MYLTEFSLARRNQARVLLVDTKSDDDHSRHLHLAD